MKNCEFSTPQNYLGEPPEAGEFWQFQEMTCEEEPARFETLGMAEEGEFVLLDRAINATDFLMVVFFIFIILGFIFGFIFRLVYPFYFRYINKKYRQ